jgi:hypothetical protein
LIIEKINHELKRFHTKPIFYWVKGHSGETYNNIVHHLAQSACRDQEIPAKDITEIKRGLALKRDLHLYHQLKEDDINSA